MRMVAPYGHKLVVIRNASLTARKSARTTSRRDNLEINAFTGVRLGAADHRAGAPRPNVAEGNAQLQLGRAKTGPNRMEDILRGL